MTIKKKMKKSKIAVICNFAKEHAILKFRARLINQKKINKYCEEKEGGPMKSNCDYCCNFEQDYETGEKRCVIDLDEDEMFDFMMHTTTECPYFQMGDEYKIVHKQI